MRWLFLFMLAGLVLVGSPAAKAEYVAGFVWKRSADYDEGTTQNSTIGNPNTDSEGAGVWQYETTDTAGDGLGGANPWYEGNTALMVWDGSWYGRTFGVWAQGEDTCAPILADRFHHTLRSELYGDLFHSHVPIVRWLNPVSVPLELKITGTLSLCWGGPQPADVDMDLLIGFLGASEDTITPLYAKTFEPPDDGSNNLSDAVDIPSLWIDPGDQVIISGRAHSPAPYAFNKVYDDLTFQINSIVPAPSKLVGLVSMGIVGLVIALRRRFRKAA